MKLQNLFITCFLLLAYQRYNSQIKVIPYGELPTASGAPTGSGMFFGASMNTNTVTFTFTGPADRWIALGFGTTMMFGADVLIYSQGQSFAPHPLGWKDYMNGSGSTANDSQQDWTIISSNVTGLARTVVATRTLNTNDVNDVAIQYSATALDVIWAHATTAIYTITQHGVSDRAYGMNMIWQSQPTAAFTTSSTAICQGKAITYSNTSTGGATSFTWNFPGGNPATVSGTNAIVTVTYAAVGTYSAVLSVSNTVGTSSVSQVNYITVLPTVVPTASLVLLSGSNPMCAGSVVQFSTNSSNTGSSPLIQWWVNGSGTGNTGPTYTSNTLANNASVTCVIIPAGSVCAVPVSASSSAMVMTVIPTSPASIAAAIASGGNPICNGQNVTFTANAGNGGASPIYQWQVNNVNVGVNSYSYVSNTFANGDVVKVLLTSNSACTTSLTANSTPITMTVSAILAPSVGLSVISGSNPSCVGHLLSLSALPSNGGTLPSYQWQVNGINSGSNGAVFSSSTFTNGSTVTCVMTSDLSCASPAMATTALMTITVNPVPPAPVINASGSATFCAGAALVLSSSSASGNNWSTGATTQSISVSASGNYSVTQTQNGCVSPPSQTIHVLVNPLPVVSMDSISDLCKGDETILLSGGLPAGGSYTGTAVSGNLFNPQVSGAGTFTVGYVYTDNNTCSNISIRIFNVSECLHLKNGLANKRNIKIYPNPTNALIAINSDESILSITVRDPSGRQVQSISHVKEKNASIDLSKEPDGIYFVEIKSASGSVLTRISKMN